MSADHGIASFGAAATAAASESVAACSETSPGRILLVDDDAEIRGIMADVLCRGGHRVTCACDGKAGWDALCMDHFDVLITDHDMPKLSGLDLLRRLRSAHLNLPVVFISGSIPSEDPDLFRCLPPGVTLEKPFSLKALLRTIQSLLASIPHRHGNRTGQTLLEFERARTPYRLRTGQSRHDVDLDSSMGRPA
jgi:two-component system, cell cycle response regulator CpdR